MFSALQDMLHVLAFALWLQNGTVTVSLLCVAQDSVNALYTKCLQQLLRDSHLVSSRTCKRENCSVPTYQSRLFNCSFLVLQKVLAKQEAQMNLMKQAVEVRGQGSGGERWQCWGLPLCPPPILNPVDFTDVRPA